MHTVYQTVYNYNNLLLLFRALSGFKADFGPLLGISNYSPARDASENSKMLEFDLLFYIQRVTRL